MVSFKGFPVDRGTVCYGYSVSVEGKTGSGAGASSHSNLLPVYYAVVAQLVERSHGYRIYSPLSWKRDSETRITVNILQGTRPWRHSTPERLTRGANPKGMHKIQSSPHISHYGEVGVYTKGEVIGSIPINGSKVKMPQSSDWGILLNRPVSTSGSVTVRWNLFSTVVFLALI